jgi:hypothetical protein
MCAYPLVREEHIMLDGGWAHNIAAHNGSTLGFNDRLLVYNPISAHVSGEGLIQDGHKTTTKTVQGGTIKTFKALETSIPTPSLTSTLANAAKVQDFYDITARPSPALADQGTWMLTLQGALGDWTAATYGSDEPQFGGGIAYETGGSPAWRLCFSFTSHYDNASDLRRQRPSMYTCAINDLGNTAEVRGPYSLNDGTNLPAAFVDGWKTRIPVAFRPYFGGHTHFTGNGTMSIVSRQSWGVCAYAFTPTDLDDDATYGDGATAKMTATTPAITCAPVFYYTQAYPMHRYYPAVGVSTVGFSSLIFNGTMRCTGMVWPEGSRSVLFIMSLARQMIDYGGGGFNGADFDSCVLAFDAVDLIRSYAGTIPKYGPMPYGIWPLDRHVNNAAATESNTRTWGVGFDPATGRMWTRWLSGVLTTQHTITGY